MKSYFSIGLVGVTVFLAEGASAVPTDKLVSGEATSQGATLVAGPRGVHYELRGGAKLDLSEGAEFSFEPSLHLKLRKPGDPETITRAVHLLHGRIDVTVPTLRDPTAVMVRGPGKLSAVAKEGRLTFIADGERTTAAARVGEMLLGIGNDWKPLRAGVARTLAPEDPAATPRPILGASTVSADAKLLVVRGTEAARVSTRWTALPNAARYDVTVMRTGGAPVTISHQELTEPTLTMNALTPGSYAVVVAAIDKQGLVGTPSEPCAVRVMGVEAPTGSSTLSDGSVVVGKDQHVTLVAAEGLEVSYGTSPLFMAAPRTLSLAHGAATMVRFRAPGSTEEAVLHLEPEGLHANVDIGPHAASWPTDRVAIQIDLYDTSGRPVPDDTQVDATVTVNMTKIAVSWERKGRTLRATLPAGVPPGPWVVRTEVRDPRGQLIGRNFLEIVPTERHSGAVAER